LLTALGVGDAQGGGLFFQRLGGGEGFVAVEAAEAPEVEPPEWGATAEGATGAIGAAAVKMRRGSRNREVGGSRGVGGKWKGPRL